MASLLDPLVRRLRTWNRLRLAQRQRRQALAFTPEPLALPVAEDARIDPATIPLATSDTPEVSIIVPAYGQPEVTLRCLASLHRHPPALPYEVLVVEDASGAAGADRPGQVPGVRFVSHPQNLGFLRSCNAAARLARGRYLLLLNNDTQVLPGAVDALRRTFDRHPRAGLVGSRLVYPDGRLQEAGGIVWSDGSARNVGRGGHRDDPRWTYLREVDYVSGASIMVEAALWRALGGFDERFAPAYYEDTDLAMQVRQQGRLVLYQPASVVVHLEGVSSGTDATQGIKRHQVINARTFADKWAAVLAREHLADTAEHLPVAAERAQGRHLVLVTNDQVIRPDMDAGSRAIGQSIDALLALGHVVKFWPARLDADAGRHAEALRQRGVEVIDAPDRPGFDDWLRAHGRRLAAVVLHRPEPSLALLPAVRRHSKARTVFVGHDLHHQRVGAQARLENSPRLQAVAEALHEMERRLWRQADVSAYFSQDEVDEVLRQQPGARVQRVQAYAVATEPPPQALPPGHDIVFVAGFGHLPNVDAARWLVAEVMPRVWDRVPDAVLRLVGSRPPPEVLALAADRVDVTGWVSDERLDALYRASRVAVAPLRFGAGVKFKVVEALGRGVPLVTTTVGVQGLPGVDRVCGVADDAPGMADRLVALLQDDARWLQVAADAVAYVHQHFAFDSLCRETATLLDLPPRR